MAVMDMSLGLVGYIKCRCYEPSTQFKLVRLEDNHASLSNETICHMDCLSARFCNLYIFTATRRLQVACKVLLRLYQS